MDPQIPIPPLRSSLQILHLLTHRNKNQHRQAHWWKWLSMLRRNLQKLITELETPERARSAARIAYMSDHLLPRCYLAFTQVVRDSQFSALGLVLVAELARVWKCIGGEERVSQMPRESAAVGVEDGAMDVEERAGDDVGEVVERVPEPEVSSADVSAGNMGATLKTEGVESLVSGSSGPAAKSTITRSKSKSPPRTMKAQKRKSGKVKKRSSVIDDLFRGLD